MTLRGAVHAFPLETVLQLLADTGKTGVLEVRSEDERAGTLGMSSGRLASALFEDETGPIALGAVFTFQRGYFEFVPSESAGSEDLAGELEDLLDRALVERDRQIEIRELVPSDLMRFKLSERAAERAEIKLSSEQWRVLLAVDGQRDVQALAEHLQLRRLATLDLLAGLVRAGMIDPVEPGEGEERRVYRRLRPMPPLPPTHAGEPIVLRGATSEFPLETILQLLAHTKKTGRLEVRDDAEGSTIGVADGRLVSASWAEEAGELALGAAFTSERGEFDFVPMATAPSANLVGELDDLLDRATETRDRIVAIRSLVPSEKVRFKLSDRATQHTEITLTADEWRALLAVNGERDVLSIADHLHMRRLPTMVILADLIEGGLVDVLPAPEARRLVAPEPPPEAAPAPAPPPQDVTWPFVERRRTPWVPDAAPPVVPPVEMPAEAEVAETMPAEPEAAAEPETTPVEEAPLAEPPPPITEVPPPPVWETPPPSWEPAPTETVEGEAAPLEPAIDPRLAAFGIEGAPPPAPPSEPETALPVPSGETRVPPGETMDPRLAAFGVPPAEPAAPSIPPGGPAWETKAPEWDLTQAPAWEPATLPQPAETWSPTAEAPALERPATEIRPLEEEPPATEIRPFEEAAAAERAIITEAPAAPIAPPEKKKGLFGGLFGGRAAPAAAAPAAGAPAAAPRIVVGGANTRAGQLAVFANELVAGYNSGQYGKGRVEDRMLSLLMRADEQADPIDRPMPVLNDRLDVGEIDESAVSERQALPYLAIVIRQIYDDAERALGRGQAKRGFRDVRARLFGKDLSLFQAPEVAGRVPKV